MLPGARGLGEPGSGGSRRRLAVTGRPPSDPWMTPWLPATPVPGKCADLPFTQSTSPVSFPPSCSRSRPPSVLWLFERFTNWPDCLTSNDGPFTDVCTGAVEGSGGPAGLGGGAPRQATGAVASYPP